MESTNMQLRMLLFPEEKLPFGLPEGYTWTNYTGDEAQIRDWLEICQNGLVEEAASRDVFEKTILNFSNIDPYQDLFFLVNPEGKRVATICAINNLQETGVGCIHMVSVLASERGKGLSHALCRIAETKLAQAHVPLAQLTTDDWRKGACKAYLSAGWYPVNHCEDMEERWTRIITELGIDSVQMLTYNGKPDKVIYAKK